MRFVEVVGERLVRLAPSDERLELNAPLSLAALIELIECESSSACSRLRLTNSEPCSFASDVSIQMQRKCRTEKGEAGARRK